MCLPGLPGEVLAGHLMNTQTPHAPEPALSEQDISDAIAETPEEKRTVLKILRQMPYPKAQAILTDIAARNMRLADCPEIRLKIFRNPQFYFGPLSGQFGTQTAVALFLRTHPEAMTDVGDWLGGLQVPHEALEQWVDRHDFLHSAARQLVAGHTEQHAENTP